MTLKYNQGRGVDYHRHARQWRVEMASGVFHSQARLTCSYFAKAQPCGPDFTHWNRTQVDTIVCYFHRLFASMLKSRSIASLLRSRISFHTQANSFHMLLLVFGLSSNQPPPKKQCGEKRKANPVYEKEKTNRKWQDSQKWAASGEEHLFITNDEAKSSIGDHCTSQDAQPSSWKELSTTKGPLCMNTASRLRRQRRAKAKLM